MSDLTSVLPILFVLFDAALLAYGKGGGKGSSGHSSSSGSGKSSSGGGGHISSTTTSASRCYNAAHQQIACPASKTGSIIAGIVIGAVLLGFGSIFLCWFCWRRRQRRREGTVKSAPAAGGTKDGYKQLTDV